MSVPLLMMYAVSLLIAISSTVSNSAQYILLRIFIFELFDMSIATSFLLSLLTTKATLSFDATAYAPFVSSVTPDSFGYI